MSQLLTTRWILTAALALPLLAGCDSAGDQDAGSDLPDAIEVTVEPTTQSDAFAYRVTMRNTSDQTLTVLVSVSAVSASDVVLGQGVVSAQSLRAGQSAVGTTNLDTGEISASSVACYQYETSVLETNGTLFQTESYEGTCG